MKHRLELLTLESRWTQTLIVIYLIFTRATIETWVAKAFIKIQVTSRSRESWSAVAFKITYCINTYSVVTYVPTDTLIDVRFTINTSPTILTRAPSKGNESNMIWVIMHNTLLFNRKVRQLVLVKNFTCIHFAHWYRFRCSDKVLRHIHQCCLGK